MVYLEAFTIPDYEAECAFFQDQKMTCYTTFYPFGVFSEREVPTLTFEPVTFLYGGNGSGKTTLINIIAETIGATRGAPYNKSSFFGAYVDNCEAGWHYETPDQDSIVITSDDVFDYIFNIRAMNEGIDTRRMELSDEYLQMKYSHFQMRSLDDYEQLKKINNSRRKSRSGYIRNNLINNLPEQSNGQSALMYFSNKIQSNQVYLLDEPENSMSAEFQMELARFIEDSARFYNCQFIIATHSPFLLAVNHARIYDLDSDPVVAKKWTELANIRRYYDFFMAHKDEF
jgi:predicted ATPase